MTSQTYWKESILLKRIPKITYDGGAHSFPIESTQIDVWRDILGECPNRGSEDPSSEDVQQRQEATAIKKQNDELEQELANLRRTKVEIEARIQESLKDDNKKWVDDETNWARRCPVFIDATPLRLLYVTHSDINSIQSLRGDILIAIRAEPGTQLDVPDPEQVGPCGVKPCRFLVQIHMSVA